MSEKNKFKRYIYPGIYELVLYIALTTGNITYLSVKQSTNWMLIVLAAFTAYQALKCISDLSDVISQVR